MKKVRIGNAMLYAALCACVLLAGGCSAAGSTAQEPVEGLDQLGAVEVVAREEGSGTRTTFAELLGFSADAEDGTDGTREDAVIETSSGDVRDAVTESQSAIGYVSLGVLDDAYCKILDIDGIDPTEKNYPLTRSFYLAHSGELSDLAQDFLTYVTGVGQTLVGQDYEAVGGSNLFLSDKSAGSLIIGGSTSVAPLMENLAEAYMEYNPNAQITVEATDSADGLNGAINGEYDLGMSSRDLKDYERELLDYTILARDKIIVVVNPDNPLENISSEQLKAVYTGTISEWSELNAS